MFYEGKTYIVKLLLIFPLLLQSQQLSKRSQKFIKIFNEIFPDVDIKKETLYGFIQNKTFVKEVAYQNIRLCSLKNTPQNRQRVSRSVLKLFDIPLDLESTTPSPATFDYDPDHYNYISKSTYDNFNMTNSELDRSLEGWDYSPYIDPRESTTEFIFPSWNYGGHCPEAFFKVYTAGETDPTLQTLDSEPDNVLGYTDRHINTFEEAFDTFWATIKSIPHKCDNYTSIFKCIQGEEIKNPNLLSNPNDPFFKK